MMDDAAWGVGTAVLQYVEKHLAPNKCKNITSAIQVTTDIVKEPVEEAYRAVESITVQRENKGALRKESKSCRQTYAVALKGNVPFAHSSNLARARARRCQVLIDKDPNMEQNNLNGLSKRELVTKANEAVGQLDGLCNGEEISFIGVIKLANGGVVYEMSMESAAKWIATHHMEFICKFSMVSVIKDWSATAIVEYMPVAFNPGVPAELRAIELRSNLPPNSLMSACWIKPI